MASGAATPTAPRTAPQQPYQGAVPRRPGAGVALRDLAPDLNNADLRFLFDRYGQARPLAARCRAQGVTRRG
jgi:hypothetical protein